MKKEKINTAKMQRWIIIMVLMFGLIGSGQLPILNQAIGGTKEDLTKSDELKQRGNQLRKAIDEIYEKLADAKALKIMGAGRNNITNIVVKYIPIGTSFDDAEAILRAAGFKVGKRTMNYDNKPRVLSEINHYKLTPLLGNTSIDVVLRPPNKDDWSTVQSLEADITIQYI
jgi:hypothetical protein